jgi:hypothetical protein
VGTLVKPASALLREQGWAEDVRPDKKNREFKSLYAGDIVRYTRGSNKCLGLGPAWIVWSDRRGPRTWRHDGARPPLAKRYYAARAKPTEKMVRILTAPAAGTAGSKCGGAAVEGRGGGGGSGERKSRWDKLTVATSKTPSFISIHSPSPATSNGGGAAAVDSGSGSGTGATISEETHEEMVLRRTAAFNVELRETPHNIRLWKQYADFQDEALGGGGGGGGSSSGAGGGTAAAVVSGTTAALIGQKKLGIYEKALKRNPRNEDVLADYLDMCRATLDLDEVEARWKRTMFTHAGSPRLWRAYLVFFTSELSRFKMSAVGWSAPTLSPMSRCRTACRGCRMGSQRRT